MEEEEGRSHLTNPILILRHQDDCFFNLKGCTFTNRAEEFDVLKEGFILEPCLMLGTRDGYGVTAMWIINGAQGNTTAPEVIHFGSDLCGYNPLVEWTPCIW